MEFELTQRQMRLLAYASREEKEAVIGKITVEDALDWDAEFESWAHKAQLPPQQPGWRTWLMLAGRGFGKTRAGAEWIEKLARSRPGVRIALVGATIDDARRVMVEGVSGILSVATRRRHKVKWEPSLGRLSWPNGSQAQLFSGDNPDGLRGPEHDFVWVLTFEVIADAAAVPLAGMLADVSGGAIDCSIPGTLQGYAAYGSTIAAAVEPVVEMLGIDLSDNGSVLKSPTSDLVEPREEELGCGAGPDPKPRTERSQLSARSLPAALSLSYYDPAREYQTGLARASIEAVAAGGDTIDLAAVMEAPAAKAVAETVLARRWAERDKLTLRLPPGYLSLRPGSRVRAAGESRPWKAERVTIDSLAVLVELRPIYSTIDSVPADPGRVLPSAGVVPTPTTVAIVELPDDGSGASDSPVVVVAASTSGANWRTVPLLVEIGGSSLTLKTASARAVMGVAENALGGGPSTLFDLLNTVDVELANGDDWLESRTDDALIDGANLALVGSELIQFGDALPLGSNRFRLSRLLRGRRGSEWAMGIHQPGDRFVIVDAARLAQLHLNSAHAGARIGITPQGPADTAGGMVELAVIGEAMRPPSPVHLRASIAPDGALRCAWVRRSRRGWSWLDGVDAPLDSAVELYRVTVQGAAGSLERESGSRSIDFTAADLAVLAGSEVQIRVAQIGELAVSRPTVLSLTIN